MPPGGGHVPRVKKERERKDPRRVPPPRRAIGSSKADCSDSRSRDSLACMNRLSVMVRTPASPAFPLLRAADRSVSTLNDQERAARGKMV